VKRKVTAGSRWFSSLTTLAVSQERSHAIFADQESFILSFY
jgi:hypothetical protein